VKKFLLGACVLATSAFGMTEFEIEDAKEVISNLEVTDFSFEAEAAGDDSIVHEVEFYDKVNTLFQVKMKNNSGHPQVEIGAMKCLFNYKTLFGASESENVEKEFTKVMDGYTAVTSGTKKLCTRSYACRTVIHFVGCEEAGCYKSFDSAINYDVDPTFESMCMIWAKGRIGS